MCPSRGSSTPLGRSRHAAGGSVGRGHSSVMRVPQLSAGQEAVTSVLAQFRGDGYFIRYL